ncbi:hypothetical protein V8G54_008948 [Vigna mungo]|uniref:Uncharacterized protein n=1 Tax=Vigna mungo TaxID=3915 RepID=A0AAQ3P440_VIGMU
MKAPCSVVFSAASCAWHWKPQSRLQREPYPVVQNPCHLRLRHPIRWHTELHHRTQVVFVERSPSQQCSELEERAKRFRIRARRNRERRGCGVEKGERKPAPPGRVGRRTRCTVANRRLWGGASPVRDAKIT